MKEVILLIGKITKFSHSQMDSYLEVLKHKDLSKHDNLSFLVLI